MNAHGHFVCVLPYQQATVPDGKGGMVSSIVFELTATPQNKVPLLPALHTEVRVYATWHGDAAREFCNTHAAQLCNGGTVYAELQNVRSVGVFLLAEVTRMCIESPTTQHQAQ